MLAYSFHQAFPDRAAPAVFLEGHGRDAFGDTAAVDLSETVGWFTTMYPIQTPDGALDDPIKTVKVAKDTRRSVPGHGLPYFIHRRYASGVSLEEAFGHHDPIEILFSYTGVYQQLESEQGFFERETASTQLAQVSPQAKRMASLEVIISIQKGQAHISLSRHKAMKHQAQLQKWADLYIEALEAITQQLAGVEKIYTLSDFPPLRTTYSDFQDLVSRQLSQRGIQIPDVRDIYPCSPIQNGILLAAEKGTASYATHWVWKCSPHRDSEKVYPARLADA